MIYLELSTVKSVQRPNESIKKSVYFYEYSKYEIIAVMKLNGIHRVISLSVFQIWRKSLPFNIFNFSH